MLTIKKVSSASFELLVVCALGRLHWHTHPGYTSAACPASGFPLPLEVPRQRQSTLFVVAFQSSIRHELFEVGITVQIPGSPRRLYLYPCPSLVTYQHSHPCSHYYSHAHSHTYL